jgi:hypothetical protein
MVMLDVILLQWETQSYFSFPAPSGNPGACFGEPASKITIVSQVKRAGKGFSLMLIAPAEARGFCVKRWAGAATGARPQTQAVLQPRVISRTSDPDRVRSFAAYRLDLPTGLSRCGLGMLAAGAGRPVYDASGRAFDWPTSIR